MKKIVFILLSFCLAQEMEVDGGLTVTEGVTAASFIGNGSGLSGIGIKPERIYSLIVNDMEEFFITVPDDKIWNVKIMPTIAYRNYLTINDKQFNLASDAGGVYTGELWLTAGTTITHNHNQNYSYKKVFSIF